MLGDTNEKRPILQDAEIQYQLNLYPSAHRYTIAALLCDFVVAKYSSEVDKQTDSLRITASQRREQYRTLALLYRSKLPSMPYNGGQSRSEKQSNRDDPDRILPPISTDGEFSVANQERIARSTGAPC